MKLSNGKLLKVTPSQRGVEIPHIGYYCEEVTNTTGIEAVKFDNDISITLGDFLPVKLGEYSTEYKVNAINKNNYNYVLEEFPWNEGNIFLLPLVFNSLRVKGLDVINYLFINSYNNCTHKDWLDKRKIIYIAYRYSPCEYFQHIEESLTSLPNYIGKIDDGNVRLYALKILPTEVGNYEDIISYSKELAPAFIKSICKLFKLTEGAVKDKLEAFEIESCIGTRQAIADEFGVNIADVPQNVDINKALKFNKNKLVWQMR